MLVHVQIEHELSERAVQPRDGTDQRHETASGHLAGAVEVEAADRRPDIHMIARLEIESRRYPDSALLAVVLFRRAFGHALMQQVG